MSNAETAEATHSVYPGTPNVQHRHLHAVEPLADDPEAESEPRLELTREQRRDHDAIQTFIRIRDTLWANGRGLNLEDAIYKASLEYDSILSKPLTNWGPEPTGPKPLEKPKDPNPASSAGFLPFSAVLPELKPEFPKKYEKVLMADRDRQIEEVRRMYAGEDGDKVAMAEKNEKLKKIRQQFKSVADNKSQGPVEITDEDTYVDKDGKTQKRVIKGSALKLKEQLDFYTPAIDASYKARIAALEAGKSIVEADQLGADEYERVLAEISKKEEPVKRKKYPTLSPDDLRESLAIKDFNDERDMMIPVSRQHGEYERGWALHRAVSKYKERLHLMGHGHEGHGEDHHTQPTPPPLDTPTPDEQNGGETKEKGARAKKARAFAKNAFTVMKAFVSDKSKRSALIREPLYRINDTVGNFIDDSKWLVGNRLLGRAGLNNQFVDWQHVLDSQPEPGEAPHEKVKTERKEKANTYIDSILEPVMRNWNYRATPQDKYVMPANWPRSEREHPHEAVINSDTLVELGIRVPKNQVEPLVDYLNDALSEPVDRALSRTLNKTQAEELARLQKTATADEMKAWVETNIPNFAEIIEDQINTVLRSRKYLAFRNFLNTRVTL